MESLWGEEFNIPEIKKQDKKSISKIKSPKDSSDTNKKGVTNKKSLPLSVVMENIRTEVLRVLGSFAGDTICIRDVDTYEKYIDACIENGAFGLDTETNNSLVPHTCKIMGMCIYTPGQKNAYIPVNHIKLDEYENGNWVLLERQLTEDEIKHGLKRLIDSKAEFILSNGKFDYQVFMHTCDCKIRIDFDTQSVAHLLNENELKGLKAQYVMHIDSSSEKYDIENLFEGLPYAIFDPELFALYAATDAYKSFVLAQWQKKQLELPENQKIKELYYKIEQPLHTVVADMEWRGVEIDKDFASRLSKRYHDDLTKTQITIDEELNKLNDVILAWRNTPEANERYFKDAWLKKNPDFVVSRYATQIGDKWKLNSIENMPFKIDETCSKSLNQQLSDPVVLTSSTQIAILLYDILKVGVIDKKKPRSTADDVMSSLEATVPLCKAIQDQKHLIKMLGTYIDKLPADVLSETNALHCHYLPDGTVTGRFASKDPNTQNIPSAVPEIRLMFKARDGYKLIGSDYSAQEPRITAFMSQDSQMIQAYQEGKDLYRVLASNVFHNTYEENGEFWEDGTPNPEGKHRRKICKKLLLGLTYGMSEASLGESIGCSTKEASELYNSFIDGFPELSAWVERTKQQAHENGYVEGLLGRRRRLPDVNLPLYDVKYIDSEKNKTTFFNPLLNTSGINHSLEEDKLITSIKNQCMNSRGKKDLDSIRCNAKAQGIEIQCYSDKIATAERQSVNAIIQGSAATMTKRAMYLCATDPFMVEHDCHMLIPIHDELLCECPEEYVSECADRLTFLMRQAAEDLVGKQVPFKCDPTEMTRWYEDEIMAQYQEYVKDKLLTKGMTNSEAFAEMMKIHPEFTEEEMHFYVDGCFEK